MTAEEKKVKQREWSLKSYHKNKEKINAAKKKPKMELKCPCSRIAVTKLAGIPICSFCLNIESKSGRF